MNNICTVYCILMYTVWSCILAPCPQKTCLRGGRSHSRHWDNVVWCISCIRCISWRHTIYAITKKCKSWCIWKIRACNDWSYDLWQSLCTISMIQSSINSFFTNRLSFQYSPRPPVTSTPGKLKSGASFSLVERTRRNFSFWRRGSKQDPVGLISWSFSGSLNHVNGETWWLKLETCETSSLPTLHHEG